MERVLCAGVDSKVECIYVRTGRVGLGMVVGVYAGGGVCLPVPVVFIADSHIVGGIIVQDNCQVEGVCAVTAVIVNVII